MIWFKKIGMMRPSDTATAITILKENGLTDEIKRELESYALEVVLNWDYCDLPEFAMELRHIFREAHLLPKDKE